MRVVEDVMKEAHLKAVIVRVTIDGKEILTRPLGDSMTGVPATTAMHFRNGAVAISYVSTLLLKLVDEKKVSLDDKLSTWLPDIPHSDRVTLRPAGPDDVRLRRLRDRQRRVRTRRCTPIRSGSGPPQELLAFAVDQPLLYAPGTNWNYAHTNYVLLGLALEKATGEPMPKLLQDKVLRPLGLTNTANSFTPEIPAPGAARVHLRASGSRSRSPPAHRSTRSPRYWNPSWTITHGAIQTTNIYDMEATAAASAPASCCQPESYEQMVSTDLRGKTHAQPGCTTCAAMTDGYTYGLGLVISGDWLLQNPMFAGYAAVEAYLPSQKIAIAVGITFAPRPSTIRATTPTWLDTLFRRIGAELAPDDAPPLPPAK